MNRRIIHGLLLAIWFFLGLSLRWFNLSEKPIWSDEFATLVFSLGHSFRTIPLDRVIDLGELLQPLYLDPQLNLEGVTHHLFTESNHPPLYFLLTHFWLHEFGNSGELVSIGLARCLSAVLGAIAIPAMFGLGWIAVQSVWVGQISALLMAISPFGVYLAQEARHYTFDILWIILSLTCLILALRRAKSSILFPAWMVLVWICVNTLGTATHFFFLIVLAAIGIVTFWFWIKSVNASSENPVWNSKRNFKSSNAKSWRNILLAAVGSAVGCLVWLPILSNISSSDSGLISWVFHGEPTRQFIEPIARLLVWVITMVVIFPVENQPWWMTAISVFGMLVIIGCILRLIFKRFNQPTDLQQYSQESQASGVKLSNSQQFSRKLSHQILLSILGGIIAIFLITTYGFEIDLTLAARYQFTYFPIILVLLATQLFASWQSSKVSSIDRKQVILILTAALISSLAVVNNLAYQKADRPDWVAQAIAENSTPEVPTLITTVYKNHEQTGEMMGIAWELNQLGVTPPPKFLLADKAGDAAVPVNTLDQILNRVSRPINLWTVNFSVSLDLELQNCELDPDSKSRIPGYYFRMYRCS
ncbi:MAG: hypothetical protein ACFBSC_02985 [Microcoleaceae cyanobacterium]